MTPEQKALLVAFADGHRASIPYAHRKEARWAKRKGFLTNTLRTAGIANTRGGPQWLYVISDRGLAALEAEGDPVITPKRKDLLAYVSRHEPCTAPWHFRDAVAWAQREALVQVTTQCLFLLTEAGRAALEDAIPRTAGPSP